MDRINAMIKFVKSFTKRDWVLNDYPIKIFERHLSEKDISRRRKPFNWTAQIINWLHMRGDGYSREEAILNLQQRFDLFKIHNALPRPGRGKPLKIQFAPNDEIMRYQTTVRDFIEHILDLNPNTTWLTDISDLSTFHDDETNEIYYHKIQLRYGVDVSDINPPLIAAICKRIEEHHTI